MAWYVLIQIHFDTSLTLYIYPQRYLSWSCQRYRFGPSFSVRAYLPCGLHCFLVFCRARYMSHLCVSFFVARANAAKAKTSPCINTDTSYNCDTPCWDYCTLTGVLKRTHGATIRLGGCAMSKSHIGRLSACTHIWFASYSFTLNYKVKLTSQLEPSSVLSPFGSAGPALQKHYRCTGMVHRVSTSISRHIQTMEQLCMLNCSS